MELELHRIDLLQTSAASPGTLLVLPPGENKTQKIAVGDLSGVVQCFSVKKGEVTLTCKNLPSQEKVTAMVLGKGQRQRDKIFVATGNSIRGMTKKGKDFFRFTTGLTEAIFHLLVADSHIWAGCQNLHNHFIEAKDTGLFMSPDKIMATELIPWSGSSGWLPVVACRDCCIRVIGMDNKPLFEVATASPPTALRYVADIHGPASNNSHVKELLYGCQDGRLVQLLLDADTVRQGFVIQGQAGKGSRAAVAAIHCGADYSKTGCCDIVIGRDDGSLEVWDVDSQGQPQLVVSTQLPEGITTVDGGYITNAASPDIIVHTFTGKVIAFASRPDAMIQAAAEQSGASSPSKSRTGGQQDLVAALNARMAKEAAELAELRAKVTKERERCANAQSSATAIPQSVVDTRHRLTLQDGCFLLYLEAAVSLYAVALQSTVALTLLDMPSNVAILSSSPADLTAGNATLATYRCQESTNRLTIKFKVREGTPGKILAYIIPAIPPKSCSVIELLMKPLCMHQMVSNLQGNHSGQQSQVAQSETLVDQLEQSRPCSELVLEGNFSMHAVHSWLREVLPDVPAQLPSSSGAGSYLFKECQLGTMLSCNYTSGRATFVCDSISTLAMLHDFMLSAATAAKERVNMRYQLHPSGLQHCCSILWPYLEEQRTLARKQKLAGALQELQIQEGDTSFLADEYKQLASNSGAGQHAGKDDLEGLERAVDMFKQLYRDFRRLSSGATVALKQHLPGLEKLLTGTGSDCSLQAVVQYMLDTCR